MGGVWKEERASRGTKALPALASNIINLSWLPPDDKTDNRIAVTTQGRSSKPVDMVIEQTDRAIWENHGSSAEIKEELKLEQVEGKLSERQSLVLTTLKEYCWEKEVGISPLTISTMLSDEYGKNGRVKALATLDKLTKKSLLSNNSFLLKKIDGFPYKTIYQQIISSWSNKVEEIVRIDQEALSTSSREFLDETVETFRKSDATYIDQNGQIIRRIVAENAHKRRTNSPD